MKKPVLRTLGNADLGIAIGALSILIALTSAGVIMRYVVNRPIAWLEEVQMMLIVWSVFYGGSYCYRQKAHVSIEVLVEACPKAVQNVLRYVVFFITLFILFFMTREGFNLMGQLIRTERVTSLLHIPYALIYSAMPVGSILMILSLVYVEGTELFAPSLARKRNGGHQEDGEVER